MKTLEYIIAFIFIAIAETILFIYEVASLITKILYFTLVEVVELIILRVSSLDT